MKGTGEATLDSSVLLKASMKSAMLARAMKSGSGAFDVDDFVARLINFMGGRRAPQVREGSLDDSTYDDDDGTALNWERIGWKAIAKSRRVPAVDFMYGFVAHWCPLYLTPSNQAWTSGRRSQEA